MAQPEPQQPEPQQPQPRPSGLLYCERDGGFRANSEHRLVWTIVNNTHKHIRNAVDDAWKKEREHWIRNVSNKLHQLDVAPQDAEKCAIHFVRVLENVSGGEFQSLGCVKEAVNECILKLPLKALQPFLEDEMTYGWYSKYAYTFMQVRIWPIDVKVGNKVANSLHDWQYKELHMVASPISLPGLCKVHPAELKECFKGLIRDKSSTFWTDMTHTAENKYMLKAFRVLLHKMFEKSGIDLTGQTATQLREGVLKNIKRNENLKNFTAVDRVLENLVDFLSTSYITM
jgi:hypothetical protein